MSPERKRLKRPQINVVCTDRGRHERRRLQRLRDYRRHPEIVTEQEVEQLRQLFAVAGREGDADDLKPRRIDTILFAGNDTAWTSRSGQYVTPRWEPAAERRDDGGTSYSFRCTAPDHICRHNKPLRYETLAAVLDFLYLLEPHSEGDWIWNLDISAEWIDRVARNVS